MKPFASLLVVFTALTATWNFANAETLDQDNPESITNSLPVFFLQQTITAGITGKLVRAEFLISVQFSNAGDFTTVTARVLDGPNGSVLGTSAIVIGPGEGGLQSFDFSAANIEFTSGDQFSIAFSRVCDIGTTGNECSVNLLYSRDASYAGGSLISSICCIQPSDAWFKTYVESTGSEIEKEIISGDDPVGIALGDETEYEFKINYTAPSQTFPVRILDTVPGEFEVTGLNPTDGIAFDAAAGKGPASKSATKIVWDIADGTDCSADCMLTVTIETRESKGGRVAKFSPTSCGPLPLNDGATAYEVDPGTGEIVTVTNPDTGLPEPVIFAGPSNSLEVTAVAGEKPCGPDSLSVILNGSICELTWVAGDGNDGLDLVYNIYRNIDGSPFSLIVEELDDTMYDDTQCVPDTEAREHCYQVKPVDIDGVEGNEATECVTVPAE